MKMNHLGFVFSLSICISSCQKDLASKTTELSKIYFNGYDPNVGTSGVIWSEIYSINPDGSDLTQLTNFSVNGTKNISSIEPCFNFDTSRLAFVSNKSTLSPHYDIYSQKFDNSDLINQTNVAGPGLEFYKPTGIKAATVELYLLEYELFNNGQIVICHAAGGSPFGLYTQYPIDGDCRDPSWIKPHLKFVYTSDKSGAREIYTVENSGMIKTQLTFNGLDKSRPKASPDATKIIFASKLNTSAVNHSEVFIMNIDGSNITQLTDYSNGGTIPKITGAPVFSPDGQNIIYTSNESGNNQIYIMKIDGTGKRKITSTNMKIFNPIAR